MRRLMFVVLGADAGAGQELHPAHRIAILVCNSLGWAPETAIEQRVGSRNSRWLRRLLVTHYRDERVDCILGVRARQITKILTLNRFGPSAWVPRFAFLERHCSAVQIKARLSNIASVSNASPSAVR